MAAAPQESQDSEVRLSSYQDECYLHGFLEIVGDLQKAGVLQDVVLEVEGRRFPCHRLVLSAASPYFRAMFTSDMAESRHKTVVLQGLDVAMFEEILSYIYSGTLHVSLDKVQPLYQAADLLQLDYVRDTCSSYMAFNVEHGTCVELYKFADVFSVDIVLKHCLQCICKHFVTLASSDEFCSLSVNQLTKIISYDELDVKEETTVWEAVVRWVQHSREDRLHQLPSILPHIRFNLMTPEDKTAILEHPLVREDLGSSKVIRERAKKRKLKPRLGMTTEMLLLYDMGKGDLLFMNPQKGKYISDEDDIFPDSAGKAFTSDHNIYVLEHDLDDSGQMSMFKYNHAGNEFEDAGMSTVSKFQREYSGWPTYWGESLIEVDQILYYIAANLGEGSGWVRMKKYSRQKDQWQQCSQLRLDGTWHRSAALSCGPYLYFILTSAMYCYDPSQDCWSERNPPNLETRHSFLTAVAMGTEIFCTDIDFNQTRVYDTESGHWKTLQGWPNQGNLRTHEYPHLFVLENQLHVLLDVYDTAKEGPSGKYLVYVYDRSADAWRDLKAILPDTEYYTLGHLSSVACLYLPFLKGAQNLITSYAIWQDK
ncbi:kelch repeat and BTB domain-containing protein 2-like [Branchiostoma floridae x Branchiostoma japonicum]